MPTALLMPPEAGWTPTTAAAYRLGLSPDSLRRYARSGLLQAGEHYRPGLRHNSPWVWRLDACAEKLMQLSTQREKTQHEEKEKALGV